MRAGKLDIVVETGALWQRVVEVYKPDTPIEVQMVAIGSRVFVNDVPLLVYSMTPQSGGRTTIVFGNGLYNDPVMTFPSTARICPAVPVTLLAAAAAYTVSTDELTPTPHEPVAILTEIAADGLSLTLTMEPETTTAMGDLAGSHSWDCYVQSTEWDWQRILEGTLTIIRGDTP